MRGEGAPGGILCANTTAQPAAVEALDHGAKEVALVREEYELRRNYTVRSLNDLGLPCFKPLGAFYVFPQITSAGPAPEFSMGLLEKKVACVPGPTSARAAKASCVATSLEQIKVAMQRIGDFVTEVRLRGAGGRHLRAHWRGGTHSRSTRSSCEPIQNQSTLSPLRTPRAR